MTDQALAISRLCCPLCKGPIERSGQQLECKDDICGRTYALSNSGVPDFIDGAVEGHLHEIETDFFPKRFRAGPFSRVTRHEFQFEFIRSQLASAVRRTQRPLDLLDVGCGTRLSGDDTAQQQHLDIVEAHCASYAGLDPSWQVLETVNSPGAPLGQLRDAMVVRGLGESLPFPTNSFDVVMILSVLDHCVEPDLALREARRVLRPRGILLITLGKRDAWHFRVLHRVAPGYERKLAERDHHHAHFSVDELGEMLVSAGFADVESREFGYVSLPKRIGRVEEIVFRAGTMIMPDRRLQSGAARLDRVLERRLPGMGTGIAVVATAAPVERV